ncbi:MAG: recombinase family protein [Oscillospiraceae bacterium]|nr:recombinase family protein [Oscillospiraceae bacterium]
MSNRRIVFGYSMENGRITVNPSEVLAVLTIFSQYLAGESMKSIASQMKVPYRDDATIWNKNMVKRILENEKYLGKDGFPQLISEEIFQAVNQKRVKKATSLCVIPRELQEIRNLTFCKECGRKLFRKGGNTRSERWDCYNPECSQFDFRLTDHMLTGAVLNILNMVITNQNLLQIHENVINYVPDSNVIRLKNEINHMLDNPQIDEERIKSVIFRLAEMKYNCCDYSDVPQKTLFLKALLADQEQLHTLDIGLLKSCVKRMTVSHFFMIEIEFVNGAVIKNIIERTGKNGHST